MREEGTRARREGIFAVWSLWLVLVPEANKSWKLGLSLGLNMSLVQGIYLAGQQGVRYKTGSTWLRKLYTILCNFRVLSPLECNVGARHISYSLKLRNPDCTARRTSAVRQAFGSVLPASSRCLRDICNTGSSSGLSLSKIEGVGGSLLQDLSVG